MGWVIRSALLSSKLKKNSINAKKTIDSYLLNKKLLEPGAEPFLSQWQQQIRFSSLGQGWTYKMKDGNGWTLMKLISLKNNLFVSITLDFD